MSEINNFVTTSQSFVTVSRFLVLYLLIFCIPLASTHAGQYELTWHTIDGGGGVSSGGQYIVSGTIGQPDACVMSGGSYEVLGGFWPGEPLCTVDFHHFARFAELWLETGPGLAADLYEDNIVDELDLRLFVDEWLDYCPLDWPLR